MTFAKWVEKGFRAKQGETAVRVKSLRLFHSSQVEPMPKEDQAEYLAKRTARIEAKTADKLPKISPVSEPPKPATELKPARKNVKVLLTEPGNA